VIDDVIEPHKIEVIVSTVWVLSLSSQEGYTRSECFKLSQPTWLRMDFSPTLLHFIVDNGEWDVVLGSFDASFETDLLTKRLYLHMGSFTVVPRWFEMTASNRGWVIFIKNQFVDLLIWSWWETNGPVDFLVGQDRFSFDHLQAVRAQTLLADYYIPTTKMHSRCTRDALEKITSLRHSMNKCIIYFQHHLFAVIWGVMWVLEVIRADVRRADSILVAPVPLR